MRKIIIFFIVLFFSAAAFASMPKEEEALFVAKKAIEDGFYDVSLSLLQRFLDNYPQSALKKDADFYIGQCYFYQKKYQEAIKQFSVILDLPGSSSMYDTLYYWLAESYFKNNEFDNAYNFYEKLTNAYPKSSYGLAAAYSLGWCLFEENKFSEAKEKFLQFKNKYPQDTLAQEAAFKAAECLYNLKDYAQLKTYIENFIKEYPKTTKIAVLKFYSAESSFYLGDYQAAFANYQEALNAAADNNIKNLIFLGIGWSYLKTNEYSRASENFDKVIDVLSDKKNSESLLLGEALSRQMASQFKEAKDIYAKLINEGVTPAVQLEAYLGKAEVLQNLGEYNEAISLYKQAENLVDSKSADALIERLHYGIGNCYIKSGKFKEAKEVFLALSAQAKNNTVKIACLTKMAETALEAKEPQEAINIYQAILKDNPDCPSCDYVQYNLGQALLGQKSYALAAEVFKKFLERYPQSQLAPECYLSLANCYFKSGDFLNAYLTMHDFVEKYPNSPQKSRALLQEGFSLKAMKKFQDAVVVFKEITTDSNQKDIHTTAQADFELADCLYYLGNQEEALSKFEALRSKYPDPEICAMALWRLAEHYFKKENFDLASRYLLGIIQNYGNLETLINDSYYMLGMCYEREGKFSEAVETFIKVSGRESESYPMAAEAYKAAGDFNKALTYYRLGLKEKDSDKPKLQFKLAVCLEEMGNQEEALKEYAKIKEYEAWKDNKEYVSFMVKGLLRSAQIFLLQENWQLAFETYQKIAGFNVEESKFAEEKISELKTRYLVKARGADAVKR